MTSHIVPIRRRSTQNQSLPNPNSPYQLPHIDTPLYAFPLPGFEFLQNPEPFIPVSLKSVGFRFFHMYGEQERPAYGRPLSLLVWSKEANLVYYSNVPLPLEESETGTLAVGNDAGRSAIRGIWSL